MVNLDFSKPNFLEGMSRHFEIAIDTGGTFTDCIASDQTGKIYRRKILSNSSLRGKCQQRISATQLTIVQKWDLTRDILQGYTFQLLTENFSSTVVAFDPSESLLTLADALPEKLLQGSNFALTAFEEAPVLGVRLITDTALSETFPSLSLRVGSTKGTNALLELKGANTGFVVSAGFKDLLRIGNQARPDIFALHIQKPAPLYAEVAEIQGYINSKGEEEIPLQLDTLEAIVAGFKAANIESVAICLKNAYLNPSHEQALKAYFSKHFSYVNSSTELSPQIHFQHRAETTVVNAYLAPVIHRYLSNIASKIGESNMRVMTSAGSLVNYAHFYPKDSLFSGPAGGVVGAADVARQAHISQFIAFDMGGTSTDVARYDGGLAYRFIQKIGNAQILSPALAIETVAAGGGSICSFDGFKLSVGPESAGSSPGPACYGAGGPLAITDVNVLLGRLDSRQFGIPIYPEHASNRLTEIVEQIAQATGTRPRAEEVLEGFRRIANEKMADTVRKISIAKGYATENYALVAFGGAGGLHVCSLADLLGIRKILLPLDAGLLSAYGIAQALVERFAEATVLQNLLQEAQPLADLRQQLTAKALAQLTNDGIAPTKAVVKNALLFVRLKGQDTSIEVPWGDYDTIVRIFKEKYVQMYGHWTSNRAIEVESARVIVGEQAKPSDTPSNLTDVISYTPSPTATISAWVENQWQTVPVFTRESLQAGAVLEGFALFLDKFSTTVIEKGWVLQLDNQGSAIITKTENFSQYEEIQEVTQLELFTNRFMSIADNMGVLLQRTSLSVNVKERLDFSCALLDAQGELIANAPHIPVHLGSLGVCVRKLLQQVSMGIGDVVVTNHPKFGGSHLPDVTLVAPVHTPQGDLIGYVVNRCHHSEIGGIRPASMPPNAKNLAEEGVVLPHVFLVKNHQVTWDEITHLLQNAPYPTRALDENLADLQAALASIYTGTKALQALVAQYSLAQVHYYMELLKSYAAQKMQKRLQAFADGVYEATEYLDDNTPLCVRVALQAGQCTIDFTGTGGVHAGNLNANEAIVNSVVIYVLRLLLHSNIPLNDGILRVARLHIPPDTLLNPSFPDDPRQCPAVVGGNVELSQRLTDTLLKAFGVVACSQGTMNNTLFGNESFGYYETICGGSGAGEGFEGASGVHTHMTNTRITDAEILERRYPVVLKHFGLREGSGGKGKYNGGDGIERHFLFLQPVKLSLLTQHRRVAPYGLQGGTAGQTGEQYLIKTDGTIEYLAGIDGKDLLAGEQLVIKTPGGGGFGNA